MSERRSSGNRVHMRSSMYALATLGALVLALAGSSRAQAQSTAAKTARARQSAPKGQQEGIKVHGHWTIEVRKPDGKLVTHREFENSLAPIGQNNGGAQTIEGMLGGAFTPQAFQIVLNGTSASQSPASAPAPCLNGNSAASCTVQENIPPQTAQAPANCPSGSKSIFCTLTRTPPVGAYPGLITGPPPSTEPLTFQGSFTAPQAGYVGNVALNVSICNVGNSLGSTTSPADCVAGNFTPTTVGLPNPSLGGLTGTALSAPVQVTAAGETVTVSVVLSFQ
jgi:hypothetical protein